MQELPATRSILDSLRRVVGALRRSAAVAEQEVGLSGAQLFVLHRLGETPGLSLNDLASRTHTHQSSVSVVVSRLVERGLVVREASAEDRRRVVIALTAAGRRLQRRAAEPAQARMVAAIARMPASDRRALDRTLAELVRGMGVAGPAPLFFEGERAGAKRRSRP
jgi:DNA-binding MarR family transcriptional regulator